jgi:3-oxoacyl-[acyl-carrier protein] reductase
MDLNLTGRHALVCGASEGIGRAAAHELALLGASVTLLARRADVLAEVMAALPRTPGEQHHDGIAVDVADAAPLQAKVSALAAARPIHILVNNTGGPPGGRAIDAVADDYLAAFHLHLLANQLLAQLTVPGMRAAGWGRIINVVSTSVKEPIANLGVSNTIRGAVASWAKTLSKELGAYGITVNNVLPGYTRTGRLEQILRDRVQATGKDEATVSAAMLASVPAGRFAEAHEVAAAIAFLATPAAGYVNGVSLAVDGGRMQSI